MSFVWCRTAGLAGRGELLLGGRQPLPCGLYPGEHRAAGSPGQRQFYPDRHHHRAGASGCPYGGFNGRRWRSWNLGPGLRG